MARFSTRSLPILIYFFLLLAGGIAAKSWHQARADRAVYSPAFSVAPPATGAPGSSVEVPYETRHLGKHSVCEVGNLRVATAASNHGHGSGGFSSRIPDPADPSSKVTSYRELAGIQLQITNCTLELDGESYSIFGPKRLLIVDRTGKILENVLLKEEP